ncbi:ribosome biogenesis GTPase RsgA [Marinilactibacillus psychrotolerans]|uniref:Small ribosomal subunit biogenesis GTPase RsgA n=2 Tax=Marinilactibacillus psychrotolerans TaxID=191770 RepID=A0AAV3WQR0_9LACT|nr:ribosome small subunit-dependent GTPase A [Marinilactibacillus psychrotolerans]SDB95089.1 ribosome biogenesis GTPase [Marinilactibacillus psychrotolerans]SJN34943.1 Ribosome small subunit-stimulated GTPase EngC [Marinilactibacillus psychrotolerans 42ea]GEL66194.1 putative ribosome biogenesis GTPase RsgA [Marinilactibacillus psychrotolerans]GEQ32932.1 ribosome biogenesis GTPase RsgA [Marinilactibacillus psychrotolerans]GEQ34703.1 ribosome biogenesis GTPase RsgA [Marinilactibacillus psychroto
MQKGQITKALSGFYYVTDRSNTIYQTRARGVFRKQKITPLVGDYVEFESGNQDEGVIQKLLERKNELTRPQVANVDIGIIIMSAADPKFSNQLLDRFLIMLESKHIKPIIFITKMDLLDHDETIKIKKYQKDYNKIGYQMVLIEKTDKEKKKQLEILFNEQFKNNLIVFMGQSGAGKSTLLNVLNPELELKTGETSQSLGRGKHTTRHVELVPLLESLIADTPGFSLLAFDEIEQESLSEYFPEMWRLRSDCKFSGCLHLTEPGCAVKKAILEGEIPEYRYDNYRLFLEEIKKRKPKYRRKGES